MYVKTIAPSGAKLFFVGEAPGEYEDQNGKPFDPNGSSGRMLDKLLNQANLSRYEVIIGNVVRERPPGNKIEFFFEDKKCTIPKPILLKYLEELKQEIILYRPNIVVGLGQIALWALTGFDSIKSARGYLLPCTLVPGQKVLCTYHPMKLNHDYTLVFPTIMDIRKAVRESKSPLIQTDQRRLNSSPSKREFLEYIDFLQYDHGEGKPIGLDIETTPTGHLDILGLSASSNDAISFTFIKQGKALYNTQDEFNIWRRLGQLFEKKSIIMHNGLFDTASMWYNLGILAKGYDKDTMIATHVCWPEMPRSLEFISSICLTVPKWKHTAQDNPAMYNCEDAANTYGCWEFLSQEISKLEAWETFKFEMAQVWPASMLQLQGVSVDRELQKEMSKNFTNEMNYLEQELIQDIGREINFRSPAQMQKLLYEDLKLPVQYKRRKSKNDPRKVTTDAEALKNLQRKTDNPIFAKILRYKQLSKLLSSFIDIELSPEGKVHTSYNITGATQVRANKQTVFEDEEQHKSFGRWSSSKSIIIPYGSGNLQNIPKEARKMYKAPSGYKYVQADYMQAEAVVVAYEINDQPTIQLFKEAFGLKREERKSKNLDIHKLTAARNFGIPLTKVTKEQREIGKTIRHATNYSAGPGVLSAKLGCPLNQAKILLERYHATCPQLKLWHLYIMQKLRKNRTLINLLGRKHKFNAQWGDQLFKSAYSYIPQSTVGDLLNLALIRLYESYGDQVTIALQLHDAIYCIVKEELVDWCCTIMKQCMLIPLTSSRGDKYCIDIDFAVGDSWGETDDYEPNYTNTIEVPL